MAAANAFFIWLRFLDCARNDKEVKARNDGEVKRARTEGKFFCKSRVNSLTRGADYLYNIFALSH